MGKVFGFSRYLVFIAVIGLLIAAAAVLIFGGIMSVTVVLETFRHAEFNAEGARLFSTELIELIDLFLLGTVLLITSIGLYQLFIEPAIHLPEWLSVANLEQLKFNLVAVIIVMLTVLFLGAAATESVKRCRNTGLWRRHRAGNPGHQCGGVALPARPSPRGGP